MPSAHSKTRHRTKGQNKTKQNIKINSDITWSVWLEFFSGKKNLLRTKRRNNLADLRENCMVCVLIDTVWVFSVFDFQRYLVACQEKAKR